MDNCVKRFEITYKEKGSVHKDRLMPKLRIEFVTKSLANMSGLILDLGVGDFPVTQRLSAEVVGVDVSETALCLAKSIRDISLVRASGTHLPFRDSGFNAIVCTAIIEYLNPEDTRKLLGEARRVLSDGGRFLCSIFNLRTLRFITHKFRSPSRLRVHHYSIKDARRLLEEFFEVKDQSGVRFEIPFEGKLKWYPNSTLDKALAYCMPKLCALYFFVCIKL